MTIFSFNSLNTFCFRFLNVFIMISLKSLLNSASGPSCSQFLLTPLCCFYHGSHFLVFVFDICRNFRQFHGHRGWYILEALDSVICLTSSIYFILHLVAVSLWKASGSLLYMCIPDLSQVFTGDPPPHTHTHRFLPPTRFLQHLCECHDL